MASIATPHAGKLRVDPVAHRRLERLRALIQHQVQSQSAEVASIEGRATANKDIALQLLRGLRVEEDSSPGWRYPRYKSRRGQVEGSQLQDRKAFQQAVKQKSRRGFWDRILTFLNLNRRDRRSQEKEFFLPTKGSG